MGIQAQGTDLPGKVCKSIAGSSRTRQFPDAKGEICPSPTQKAAVPSWAGPAGTKNSMKARLKLKDRPTPPPKVNDHLASLLISGNSENGNQDRIIKTHGMLVEITTSEVKALSCNLLRSNRPDNLYSGAGFMSSTKAGLK